MKNLLFNGIAGFAGNNSSISDMYEGVFQSCQELVRNAFYISDKEIITHEDSRFVFLIDGLIYSHKTIDYSKIQTRDFLNNLSGDFINVVRDLDGEFSIILVDKERNSIRIVSSETGSSAFYYHFLNGQIIFSNGLQHLKGLIPGAKKFNPEQLLSVLSGKNLGSEQTCFVGIKKLLPGCYMNICGEGIEIKEYSSLFERKEEFYKNEEEAFNRFRNLFRSSVDKRMRSQSIGFSLSSGKDSTAITAMAANLGGSDQNLYSYTYKPEFFPIEYKEDPAYDETIMLKGFFDDYPEISSREIIAKNPSIVESIELSLEIFGEPIYGVSNQYWIQEMHRKLKEDGCGLLLIGQGGNFTISWPPPELTSDRRGFKKLLKRVIRGNKKRTHRLPYVKDTLIQYQNRLSQMEKRDSQKVQDLQPIYLKNSIQYVSSLQKQVALYRNIAISDPTVDKSLVKFCLSLPYAVYYDKQNSRKLVTVALRDILPDQIISNRVRGIQSSDIRYRMDAERAEMVDKLVFCSTNKLVKFAFEIERLIGEWKDFKFEELSRREINHLLRVFQVVMFLSKLDE